MRVLILAAMLSFSSLGLAHYGHYNCHTSIDCLESVSRCFQAQDRVYSMFYLVRKTETCHSSRGTDSEVTRVEREDFKTSLTRQACEQYGIELKRTYGMCND